MAKVTQVADGVGKVITLPVNNGITAVTVNGSPAAYTASQNNTVVTLDATPTSGHSIEVTYSDKSVRQSGSTHTIIHRITAGNITTGASPLLNTVLVDEEGAADTTNGVINIPANIEYLAIRAGCRFNNGAASAGTYRRLVVEMDDGTGTWGSVVPLCISEELYTAGSTADSTLLISTPKLPKSLLDSTFGSTVTKLRLVVNHDNGSALALTSLPNAGDPVAYLGVEFFG